MSEKEKEDLRKTAEKWNMLAKLNPNSLVILNAQMDVLIAREMLEEKQTA